jgi:NAD(P)-dependent dehydrogenase (short-subunit alcohol dehydrogenase family)
LRGEGLEVTGVRTDVTKLESVENLAQETLKTYGAVHVVCNNAGLGPGGQLALWDYEPADWRWCMDVNVYGVAWGIKVFTPIMIAQGEEGHIVNTTSGNGGIAPMADTPIYSVSKAAVVTMSEALLLHLRTRNTKLGASVLFPGPGMLKTKLYEAWATRPAEYERDKPRTDGHFTYDDVVNIAIVNDQFWILPESPQTEETLRKRFESMRDRRNPDYFREWKPEAAKKN